MWSLQSSTCLEKENRDMPDFLKNWLRGRRFWLTVATVALVPLRDKFNLPLTDEQLVAIALAVGQFVIGESLRSSNLKASS